MTRSETSARASRLAFACGSFARKGLIGVRVDGGAPPDEGAGEDARGGAGVAAPVGAGVDGGGALAGRVAPLLLAADGCAKPPLCRGAAGSGEAATGAAGALVLLGAGRGATSGRD